MIFFLLPKRTRLAVTNSTSKLQLFMTDSDFFFTANPSRNYRTRMATPSEIAAIDPAPDPRHFIYVVKCRHLPLMKAVLDGDVAPLPGELDDEETPPGASKLLFRLTYLKRSPPNLFRRPPPHLLEWR